MATCKIDNCENKAEYGKVSDLKRIYCKKHKDTENNLIEIKRKSKYCITCLTCSSNNKIMY